MLSSLHIRHYVLIDSLDIDFPEGLLIITGQTGAGKSILLGALSLAMGGKADSSVISEGADSCVVEAEFNLDSSVRGFLEDNDVEWDGGHVTVRRVVHSSARSRSFVNDVPVNLQFLTELSSRLLDIHSQHQSLLLKDHSWQLSLLDHYSGNRELLDRCSDVWKKILKVRSSLAEKEELLSRRNEDMEYNAARYGKLADARLKEGELEELEEEHKTLSHAEDIKSALGSVYAACNPDEGQDVSSMLNQARKYLERAASYIPGLENLAGRLESARIEIDDILSEVEENNDRISLSEDRLRKVEDRMSLLYELMSKFGCRSIPELIGIRDELGRKVEGTADLEDRIGELRASLEELSREHSEVCSQLTQSRKEHSEAFASEVLDMLRFLELDKAQFLVDLQAAEPGANGSQSAVFLFSSNGTRPEDVAKCASGGEMSRIMLCLKALMARFTEMPTMIFDEIDTGVSGSVADKMGSMICRMGKDMQVFAITHLPQVAAKGDAHYLVSKSEFMGRSTSTISRLEGESRVYEIARLLSGSIVSDAAVANARVLLEN